MNIKIQRSAANNDTSLWLIVGHRRLDLSPFFLANPVVRLMQDKRPETRDVSRTIIFLSQ